MSGETRAQEWARRVRVWLRRVMPRVAVVAGALLVLRLFAANAFINTAAGRLFNAVVILLVLCSLLYYGSKSLRWAKRKLLWRVRRRLVITYLFVGLTPIVLLGLLGLLASVLGAGQAMSRVVIVHVNATERHTLDSARTLADAVSTLPPTTTQREAQAWLAERASLIRATLPGARVAVWRGSDDDDPHALGQGGAAQLADEPSDENSRGVGSDTTPVGAPLPAWLAGQTEWSSFSFVPPTDASPFGAPSLRALVRRGGAGARATAVLLVVPVSRALVGQFREMAGINLRPYFLGAEELAARTDGRSVRIGSTDNWRRREARTDLDQFGENIQGVGNYIVVLPATNWVSGVTDTRLSFVFNFSWADARQQLVAGSSVGQLLQRMLLITSGLFLALELAALAAAAWMTRAVTGMVHKLHVATEFIKRGDFSHRIRARSHDQLGELAVAFNEMSANIEALLAERVEHERLERELEIAAEVQAQLFPRHVPSLKTAEMTGECRAARGVAGDYYDYIEIAPGRVAVTLGDVSGKGVSAALVMSNLQAALRAQVGIIAERVKIAERAAAAVAGVTGVEATAEAPCGVAGTDDACAVADIADQINSQLCRSTDANRFATLFLALYDDHTRTLRYTNAGHNDGLLVRTDGSVEHLREGGTLVGAFDFARYTEAQTELRAGDLLLVFSDGLSEAQNVTGEEYGEERLAQLAVAHRHLAADQLRHAIFNQVDAWTGGRERGDDQTVVILKAK
ncbi:MAG TPA: SpoIIE family protein phosphatase [Pyrinomonadaceae bacterium]|nr:SpoIIE family protein phosphatase [Pyrinomonadaceae bacterium]